MELIFNANLDERQLVEACGRKERWAQQKIYEQFYPIVLPVCLRYASNREDALDIMHDGFIKVFKKIGKYNLGTSLNSWIKRIMINTAIDHYRKMSRRRTDNIDTAYGISAKDESAISRLNAEHILNCLQKLTPTYRSIFNLYILEGFSHKEIAQKLNISESTSRSNLVKARKKLKMFLNISE